MPPNQHPQPSPQGGQQPQRQAPHYDYNTLPHPQQLQQHPSGQYEVVPTPQVAPNNGHTGHNPYEFIVNPVQPRRGMGAFGGKTPWKGIALIGGALVVVMIVVAVIINGAAPKGSVPGLTSAAQRQQEIIRIATEATKTATGQDTLNFAANVEFSIASSQQQTLTYLQEHGTKLKTKQLALNKDLKTDELLTNAQTAGTYDTTVVQTLTAQLQTYEGILQSTNSQTSSKSAKQLLQTSFVSAEKLLEQAKNLSTTASN